MVTRRNCGLDTRDRERMCLRPQGTAAVVVAGGHVGWWRSEEHGVWTAARGHVVLWGRRTVTERSRWHLVIMRMSHAI